ncbi:MAG: hypothetical protein JNL11_02940 [Bdellovibrionaceae bacterium]|nr:hypothetical protein [Pseudobdellovibrionaceae bacterium]
MSLLFLSLLMVPNVVFASTLFIGNGGEVYKINNQYYVRDLVEAEAHLQPHFNCSVGSLAGLDLDKLNILEIDSQLLGRKLCDFDTVAPGMGKLIIETINFHSWTMVSEELVLQVDDAPLLTLKQAERIQAANRTLFNIRIQKNVWHKLAPAHRIALIIHEMVFSLLKISCVNESLCIHYKQSSRVAREITGGLFSAATYRSLQELGKVHSLMRLSFNFTKSAPEITDPVVIVKTTVSGDGHFVLRRQKRANEDTVSYSHSICQDFLDISKPNNLGWIFILVIRKIWNLVKVSYVAEYGVEYGFVIDGDFFAYGSTIKDFNDINSCSLQVSRKIIEFSPP